MTGQEQVLPVVSSIGEYSHLHRDLSKHPGKTMHCYKIQKYLKI